MKLIIKLARTSKKAKEIGKNIFQPKRISWSYLYLGKVPLTIINITIKNTVFIENHITPGTKLNKYISIIEYHPPKNKITVNAHISIILLYSAKKNKANPIAEYSTL